LCVITRDLPQAKLWFDSAKQILDICFDNAVMQITAATETQLGHVHAKLGASEEAASHLERAAQFYLNQAKQCRDGVASSEGSSMAALDIDENKRRFYTAKLANHLFSEAASHWLNVAASFTENDEKNEKLNAKRAVSAQEKAVTAVGLMYGKSGGDISTEGSKILMHALKSLAGVYEATGDWRRAADAHSKYKTIAARVNGPQSKSVQAATQRHRKAIGKAASQRPESRPMSASVGLSGFSTSSPTASPTKNRRGSGGGGGGGGGINMSTSPMRASSNSLPHRTNSPLFTGEEYDMTGEESWLR
jgi:hypothetical protein